MWQTTLADLMSFEAEGLRLRRTDERDVELHLRLYNEPSIRQFVGAPLNLSRSEAFDAVVRRPAGMVGIFVVEDAASGCSVGECGFIGNNYIPNVDTSIMLLTEYQERGFGARVLRILCDIWLNHMHNESCVATVWAENRKAISLATSAGFSQIGEYTDVMKVLHLVYERRRAEPAA